VSRYTKIAQWSSRRVGIGNGKRQKVRKPWEPWHSISSLLAMTGLRIGELLALRWQDVELLNGFFSVRQTVYEGHLDEPKSKRSKRRIPLGPKCVEILAALKPTVAAPSALVFSARNGSPLVGAICSTGN